MTHKDYCGCCGGNLKSQTHVWCEPCSYHVRKDNGGALWECTYFAQHNKICPFDVELSPAIRQRNLDEAKEMRESK